jgi:hypothetical protein
MSSYLLNLSAGSESPNKNNKDFSQKSGPNNNNNSSSAAATANQSFPRSLSGQPQKKTASNYFKNKRNDSVVLDDTCAIWRFFSVEENVRPSITGVLSIYVKSATFLETNVTISGNSVFTALTIRNFTKKTKVIPVENGAVHWNQLKHFPIPVKRKRA